MGKTKSVTSPALVVGVALFIGGAFGSLVRLSLGALQPSDALWPWMTMVINLTGAFLLGFITAYMAALGPDIGFWRVTRLGLGTGLIGGYTTYSTFMLEVAKRIKGGHAPIAVAYLLVSIVLGLLFAVWGLMAGKAVGDRHIARHALVSDAVRRESGPVAGAATRVNESAESVESAKMNGSSDAPSPVRSSDATDSQNLPEGPIDPDEPTGPERGPLVGVAFILFACIAVAALLVNRHFWTNGNAFWLLLGAVLLGGLGAFTRYSVDAWVNNRVHLPFPCGTIVVNLTACLAMGLVAGWCGTHAGLSTLQYLLASGFLGGYSTFSTASVEGAKLLQAHKPQWAFVHTAGMMALSLGLLLLGLLW
ncbi:CrcB family protein [Bifidobacterium sp. ESL0745]|uniref:fluoride efflux transporter FluC n=1 Tax=Bifidobacterium sp. ESL0745 TaxID=2983226 RepID=UPI0023F9EB3C|nr:CrcB family protein [Bifidobacterium sp. ESL0745]MDF7664613.1 CrcB family protein [Bifidobacterium sp. ESL0745]